MLRNENRASKALAIFTLLCGMGVSSAFGAGELQALAKTGGAQDPLFLTITNGTSNSLAIINTRTKQMTFVPTGGAGGASGNSGGVAAEGKLAAAVNFGSSTVTIFLRQGNSMEPVQTVKTSSAPLSVAFGHNHLLVLGQSTAESFPVYGNTVGQTNDGVVQLLRGDKSAAQIVSFDGGAAYSEKDGDIVEVSVSANGMSGISGPNVSVTLPASPNNNTPFGMVARGANVYATIAHSNLELLVVNGKIVSSAAGPTPFTDASGNITHAPCWNTLNGQFLYSADSPGKQLLRYLVSDSNIFFDKASVATLTGAPTDLTSQGSLLGVIDGGDGATSNVTLFNVDSEGELTMSFAVKIAGPINGAAII